MNTLPMLGAGAAPASPQNGLPPLPANVTPTSTDAFRALLTQLTETLLPLALQVSGQTSGPSTPAKEPAINLEEAAEQGLTTAESPAENLLSLILAADITPTVSATQQALPMTAPLATNSGDAELPAAQRGAVTALATTSVPHPAPSNAGEAALPTLASATQNDPAAPTFDLGALGTAAADAGASLTTAEFKATAETPLPALASHAAAFKALDALTPALAPTSAAPVAAETIDALNEQIFWHVQQGGVQEARILLNPKDLGSVDIQVKLEGDRATLVFFVEQAQARQVVQAALPQLGTMFNSQGMQLADAQVMSQHSGSGPHQHSGERQTARPPSENLHSAAGLVDDSAKAGAVKMPRLRVGLLDHYA